MAATAKRTATKKPSTSTKSKAVKTSSKSSKGKKRPSRTITARNRTSSAPRQSQPTPERYMEIQQALAERGFYEGPVDGKWNASCVEALKRFQADQNLSP